MSNEIRNLEPEPLWNHFADLNAIPRPSKKEERVIQFMLEFGKSLGLETQKDTTGNVLIKKPASPGMENRPAICLQGHLDMVHQKNADTDFDFDKDGIQMYVEGNWVKAQGTTLGADNGIGVAAIMAILSSKNMQHPEIQALFTVDEETGLTGAKLLDAGWLSAPYLLNLDNEDDNMLTIGSAGGLDITATGSYMEENVPKNRKAFRIEIKGLTGGHSGADIHLGRGNANKLMNRLLHEAAERFNLRVSSINGGSLRNAIPRESFAVAVVSEKRAEEFVQFMALQKAILKVEYHTTDPNLAVTCNPTTTPDSLIPKAFQHKFLRSIYACPNGVYRMSPDIENLVQTSNNLARIQVESGVYHIHCLTRSSVDTEKMDLARAIKCAFELAGASVAFSEGYPGWTPQPNAPILKTMSNLYKELFGTEPLVNALHAGLENGIIGAKYPGMEMISMGPNIRFAHSPDEKVQISSVQKFWHFLRESLKRI